jgi:lipid II:glycine glycyltransferase (peptidoglycan interpeptide bridge formation enzyme)
MTMSAKEIYREFSRNEPSLPIFSRDWWLDAAAGPDAWSAVLVQRGEQVIAAMPYVLRKRYGMTALSQPALTPRLGPWLRASDANSAKRLADEKDLMQALIDQLPAFDYFNQNWHYGYTNWLPFSWKGFQQTTYYTYVTMELGDTEKVWSRFEKNIRVHCKKASSRFNLTIRDDLSFDDFLALNRMTYQRQGMEMPYAESMVRRLDEACAKHNCRKFFIAIDPDGRHHAGSYMVWDENSAYGMMNGSNPALRNSQATSLCFWEAIKFSSQVSDRFDFAGSMMEPVERFFRAFGTTQIPYFNISKTPSRLLRMRQGLLSVMRG